MGRVCALEPCLVCERWEWLIDVKWWVVFQCIRRTDAIFTWISPGMFESHYFSTFNTKESFPISMILLPTYMTFLSGVFKSLIHKLIITYYSLLTGMMVKVSCESVVISRVWISSKPFQWVWLASATDRSSLRNNLISLQWRYNGCDGVSTHQHHHCLLNRLCRGADQRKHQSSTPLAFAWGIHRSPVNSPHKWQVTRKMYNFDGFAVLD